ncbi:hypothetical protein HHL21_00575 [Massilia sp. RP-1-19]|uniref:Uncharacterized protein n=1 Tax=Massilia polaris TaxID=2728846 RepID=A0A848HM79_9BURK|nr:hypothetical protein [Massilia polaris]NML59608.1 hypothetical protein [Massilia polaris]
MKKSIHTSRWIWIGIGAIGVIAYTLLSRAAPVPGESCGLGMAPGTPGFAAAEERERAEVRKNGFLHVCEANLERYKISFEPMSRAYEDLAFPPVELARTPFSQFKSIGGMAEGVSKTKSRLYRGFQMPGGHIVTLFEHDMSADGTSISRNPADEPERINGMPARLSVLQAGAGDAISHLSWTEGRRYYELWIGANVAGSPLREQLFALASSLPRSSPACPNEIPPKEVVFGPDGMPVMEPPPASLTESEMKAYVDEFNRKNTPCRG